MNDVLGMWAAEREGAKFWLQIVTELKNRGVQDIFIACVDGLKGFPEAIEAVFPATQVQLCLVHLVRHSLSYVSHKDRNEVATALKEIYQAATIDAAERQLAEFETQWGALPTDCALVACQLDAHHADVWLSARGAPRHLYDQHD